MGMPLDVEVHAFETLAKRQKRIYQDACDVGVPLAEIPNLDVVRNHLNELIKFYKNDRDYSASTWATGKSVKLFMLIEQDDGVEDGLVLDVSFNRDVKVPGGGFITISFGRRRRELDPILQGERSVTTWYPR